MSTDNPGRAQAEALVNLLTNGALGRVDQRGKRARELYQWACILTTPSRVALSPPTTPPRRAGEVILANRQVSAADPLQCGDKRIYATRCTAS